MCVARQIPLIPATSTSIPLLFPLASSLHCQPLLWKCCESQGRSFAACNSKIMHRTVTQPNIPGLELPQCSRAGQGQGQGQGCPVPAGTARERFIPGSLAARCPWLRHSWPSRAGSQLILPHPAPGASRLRTLIPKVACPCSSLGRPSPEEQREAQFLLQSHGWLSEGISTRGTRPSDVSRPLPPGRECQDQGSGSDGCTGHGSGQTGEQILEPSLTQNQQHWDPSLLGPPPPHCSLGPVSMRGDLSCLLWDPQ